MVAGVAAFVVAMVIMMAVVVSHDGTTNNGVSDALIATCVYGWLGVTILGTVLGGIYKFS